MNDLEFLQQLIDAYSQAELKILDKMQQLILLGLDEDEAAETLYGKKLAQLRELREYTVKQLQQLAQLDDKAKEVVLRQFLAGAKAVSEGSIVGTDSSALNNMIVSYNKLLKDSRFQILRQTEDAYKRIIYESTILAPLGVDTRIQTARKALDKFASEGITAFVMKDGKRYGINEYTEMASRTTYANAQREGRTQQLVNDGRDLIIISSIPNPSPLCAPYQRKILSISGKDSDHTSLQAAKNKGLFHPNCRHSFTAYIPGLTKVSAPNEADDYEASQDQRYAERKTREWKRRLAVADTPEQKAKAQTKLKYWRDTTKQIAEDNDLVYKPNRISNVAAH